MRGDVEHDRRAEAQHREHAHEPADSRARPARDHSRDRHREADDGDEREDHREHMQHDPSFTTDRRRVEDRSPQLGLRSRPGRLLALGCGLLGALLFVPAISSGRLADDFVLLRTVRLVTGPFWSFTHNDLGQPAGSGAFYRPAWVLWNTAVYDVDHSPAFAHVLNLVLFAVICAEVVLLLWRLAGGRAALIGGVLFAVFPSHGESVAWISGNTDLLAVAWGLGAILLALSVGPSIWRDVGIAAFTALAMLAKEIAAVLPALMAILVWAAPAPAPASGTGGSGTGTGTGLQRWRPAIVMLATVVLLLIPRTAVVGGVGGYGGQALTPKRASGALLSFIAGGLSAPQLQLLAHPVLFLVPICALSLLLGGTYWAWRTGARTTARLAVAGLAWFLVALLPVLNQPLNLNTRNGDRLLLLPSVGLALAAGSLIAPRRRRGVTAAWGAVAALCALSCVLNALNWHAAGIESSRLLADIDRIAPPDAHLIALSVPTDYRQAHLYPDALDIAVQETGRPDVSLTTCMPVHALSLRPGQVSFRALGGGLWLGRTTGRAPFDVPVLGSSEPQASSGCQFAAGPGQPKETLGTAVTALVKPTPAPGVRPVLIYFDGLGMRRAP